MNLTYDQLRGIEAINKWLRQSASPAFVLAGYAGTGKTTLLQEFINAQDKPVLCCAPTGKAAAVLGKRLTNAKVSTIHRALYKPVTQSMNTLNTLLGELTNHPDNEDLKLAIEEERARLATSEVGFALRADRDILPGQLVVIDEASMVSKRMEKDLLATNAKILFVGDPGQLPPVMDEGFFRWHPPDVMLTEVLRQALDSPIIRLSMMVRKGDFIAAGEYGAVRKIPKSEFPPKEWLTYDQVVTGKNDSRRKVNRYFRAQKFGTGVGWWPVEGDKLICLKNDYEAGLINGLFGAALAPFTFNEDMGELVGQIIYETSISVGVFARFPFQAHYDPSAVDPPYFDKEGLREFDYGYAITVHKSQGSEWERVILADDRMMEDKKDFRRQWLYTAVTRAKEELIWLY